jgi:dTDP-4-amino-4,6-dideoxygalactose transaminase
MQLNTLIFDPSPCGFPKPRIPLLPTGLDGLSVKTQPIWASAGHFRHFTRGRYALREAYRLAGIGPGSTLLAPAYHCRTMLDPALALDGNVGLYPLRPNLSPDLAALGTLADNAPTPVKALLATHFFGIPQDFAALADWCATRKITLIEDASHALFCQQYRPPGIGDFGTFVVSSPYKFLPSPDGGLLYARTAKHLDDIHPHAPSWVAELRGLANAWQKNHAHTACDTNSIDAELEALIAQPALPANDVRRLDGWSADYHPAEAGLSALRGSRMIWRHADTPAIAQRRRESYRRWSAATMNLPYCRPLFPELPEGCIPYMLPLRIEHSESHFSLLKRLGVPIFRWDSIVASDCPTARDYRLHLLHLPCHQSLDDNDLDWMTAVIRKVGADKTARIAP